jgi:hypothetical protein
LVFSVVFRSADHHVYHRFRELAHAGQGGGCSSTLRARSSGVKTALHASLAVLLWIGLAACSGERTGGAGAGIASGGPVPAPVVAHGVTLLHGSIPQQFKTSVNEGGDYQLTPAARANGVEASYWVQWSGIEQPPNGPAYDVSGSFTALKLASGAWQLFDVTGAVLHTLCNSDGTFATKGDDYAGVYVGQTARGDYRNIRLELQRSGTTHTGTLRYTNPYGEVQTFRILGFHRTAATDITVRHMDGEFVLWAHEVGAKVRRRPHSLPEDALQVRGTGFTLGWLPPSNHFVAVTLRREGA